MKNLKTAITAIFFVLFSAVLPINTNAGWFTEDYSDVNQKIADANIDRFKAFAEGMAACKDNAACQSTLALAYGAGLGQQAFLKPESTSDLLHAVLPFGALALDFTRLWRAGTNGDSSGFVVTGNGNTFSGIGNKLSASDRSTITAPFSATVSTTTTNISGNKWYSLNEGGKGSTVTDSGVVASLDPTTEGK